MNQESTDRHDEPSVIHLTGWSGAGKTYGLKEFQRKHSGTLQILTPDRLQQPFDVSSVDFDSHQAVAIDEVGMWEKASILSVISRLEAEASKRSKKVILVTQGEDDLERLGVKLSAEPLKVRLGGRHETLDVTYDGEHVRFREPSSGK